MNQLGIDRAEKAQTKEKEDAMENVAATQELINDLDSLTNHSH